MSATPLQQFREEGGLVARTPALAAEGAGGGDLGGGQRRQTEAVLFGAGGAGETLEKGAVFVSSATMDPQIARGLGARLEASGRRYLDAPISGGAGAGRRGPVDGDGVGDRRGLRRRPPGAPGHGGPRLRARRRGGPRLGLQDDQPAPGRGAYRRRLRGHDPGGQAGARPAQGL
ncbi:MAG: NAD(P)-binding domain-containing protein [Caulobacteraceae bacterium]